MDVHSDLLLNLSLIQIKINLIQSFNSFNSNKIRRCNSYPPFIYFLAEVINININSLKFQHCDNLPLSRLPEKELSFTVTFVINTLIIKSIKKTLSKQ